MPFRSHSSDMLQNGLPVSLSEKRNTKQDHNFRSWRQLSECYWFGGRLTVVSNRMYNLYTATHPIDV